MKQLLDIVIIASGGLPVILLIAGSGSVVDILLSFWFETCLMIISFVVSIVLNRRFGSMGYRAVVALGFGMLLTVYAAIQFMMIHSFFPSLEISRVLISVAALVFLFRYTYQLILLQYRPLRFPTIMAAFSLALKRIFISNVTLLSGAALTLLMGNNLGFLVAGIGIKTYLDLQWSHERIKTKLMEMRPTW